ncbi:hypothetical protein [Plantibacter sp. ME-Dv--P-095]|uniref:hypothetical protein n=1 Tax=Plantibacter sp. ME-Dv--P-095 TaxID=3040299 RepID=UPI00254DB299|nr:hypothetical protein [Plantibacter sp. ME-Dv--P-095]
MAVGLVVVPLLVGGSASAQELHDRPLIGNTVDGPDRSPVAPIDDHVVPIDTGSPSPAIGVSAVSRSAADADFVDVDIPLRADIVTHQVTIALVAPEGTTPSFAKEDASRALELVDRFYNRETGGAVRFELERLIDWQVIDEPIGCSNTGGLHDWIIRKLGWEPGPARHLVAMVPPGDPCPIWANGEQPGDPDDGGRTFQGGPDAILLAHELGHNLSLNHASSVQCASGWDDGGQSNAPDCPRSEYGNLTDVMGDSWTFTPLSAPTLARLGTLSATRQPSCGEPRTTEIDSLGAGPGAPRVLTWADPQNSAALYWLQYNDKADARSDGGEYSSPWETPRTISGVQILRSSVDRPGGDLLERPGDSSVGNEFILAGETVALNSGMNVRVDEIDEEHHRATVTVTVPCQQYLGDIAPLAARTASYTADQTSVDSTVDGSADTFWSSWPKIGQQWIGLQWPEVVTIDSLSVRFASDSTDDARQGLIPPRAWTIQRLDEATGSWLDVGSTNTELPGRERDVSNTVRIPPLTTSAIRVAFDAWGDWEYGGSSGVSELNVNGIAHPVSMIPGGDRRTLLTSTPADLDQGVSILDATGNAIPNREVTFELSGPATFSDGSMSETVASGTDGAAPLPPIITSETSGAVEVLASSPAMSSVSLAGAEVVAASTPTLGSGPAPGPGPGAEVPSLKADVPEREGLATSGTDAPVPAFIAALLIASGLAVLGCRRISRSFAG